MLRACAGRMLAAAVSVAAVFALGGPVAALEVIDSSGGILYVEVNKGRMIRLDEIPAKVFLANPEVADLKFQSARLVYLFGKTTGETSLFVLDKRNQVVLNRKVIVGYDLDQINAAIEKLISSPAVTASMVQTTLVLDGIVGSPAEAEQVRELAKAYVAGGQILNRIKVSMPNQINLRVKIVEISRDVAKEFGLDYTVFGSDFEFSTALTSGILGGTVGAGLTKTVGGWSIEAFVSALETEGLVTVLAEPNLTTLSGEPASFLAGGEIPFGTTDGDGNAIIEYRQFGVSLAFTPTLLDDSRISIKVTPEVSQLSGFSATIGGTTVRGLTTRRADTTVELGNGESLVLGGLLQKSVRQDIAKVPGLGDLPILGALFRSKGFQSEETELMIIVTPYIVKPTSERMVEPTDGFQPPNDYESIVWGAFYRDSSGSLPDRIGAVRGQTLVGQVGFRIE